jgi:hypothetical protein
MRMARAASFRARGLAVTGSTPSAGAYVRWRGSLGA